MFMPLLLLLLIGMIELGRVAYTYYSLHKIMYTLARYLGTQQGVNFCDDGDAIVSAAKNYAVTGTTDEGADPILPNLSPDLIQVRIERYSGESQELAECECSVTGCDTGAGGLAPDFIVVSMPDGYPVRPLIPYLTAADIPLRPVVRVPYGGT